MLFKVCYVENDKITPIQQFNGYFSNEPTLMKIAEQEKR